MCYLQCSSRCYFYIYLITEMIYGKQMCMLFVNKLKKRAFQKHWEDESKKVFWIFLEWYRWQHMGRFAIVS